MFRTFAVGGSADGRTSQARDIQFTVKGTSPFSAYREGALNAKPFGLKPDEYIETHVVGATAQQRKDLARAFLSEMQDND